MIVRYSPERWTLDLETRYRDALLELLDSACESVEAPQELIDIRYQLQLRGDSATEKPTE